jgi:two-component system sensor histidine kinase ChvG
MSRPSLLTRLRAYLARIWLRLLAFNLLLVFLPLAAVFYLQTYEEQLLERQERSMVQQGRLLAAALGEGGELGREDAELLLRRLQGRTQARLRILDAEGRLLADTSVLVPQSEEEEEVEADDEPDPSESWLYRLGALPFRLLARLRPRPPIGEGDFYSAIEPFDGPEVRRALSGAYGSATRITPGGQRSVTLYSAIPIRDDFDVVGVALVSQSTFQILRDLYEIRLSIFRIFLLSVAFAIFLSLVVSKTIVRPLHRLREETTSLLDAKGRLRGTYAHSERPDEIGDLSRDLHELARRLMEHQRFTESFAADLSHEFKNPLAAIRTATDVLAEIEDPRDRKRFLRMIERDTARLEHLLSGVRELAAIDAGSDDSDESRPVVLPRLVDDLVEGWRQRQGEGRRVELRFEDEGAVVHVAPQRLAQIVDNLLDNAADHSPTAEPIEITVESDDGDAVLRVRDHGSGVPPEHVGRVFDRFFSYRPESDDDEHSGLGLAIVKAISESYGGRVEVAKPAEGEGAVFEVRLPKLPAGSAASA